MKQKIEILPDGTALIHMDKGFKAVIDIADINLVKNDVWQARVRPRRHSIYVRRKSKPYGLHQLIIGLKSVDHKDGNGLNNKRNNLRPCTNQQNQRNAGKKRFRVGRKPTSKYKGVFKTKHSWIATIYLGDGKPTRLGSFPKEKLAAKAYDEAARKYFGEFARPNFP